MPTHAHLVGSVGLGSTEEVLATVGALLGPHLKRVPDGEPGGRRLWISWQYPLLRSCTFLKLLEGFDDPIGTGFHQLTLADDVDPSAIRFPELGYAREARASYLDFLDARKSGLFPEQVRFQVSLPTPMAVVGALTDPATARAVGPAYTAAMLKEVERICRAIPHDDLAIQWDVCIEMVMWDGRLGRIPAPPNMKEFFAGQFAGLASAVPEPVELGFHLCYGDWEGKHFIEPEDAGKLASMANLLAGCVGRQITWIHMPVPIERGDDAYFEPLAQLNLSESTELILGLVHADDGADGTRKRIETARKFTGDFGIATECGMARARSPELVRQILGVHREVLESG